MTQFDGQVSEGERLERSGAVPLEAGPQETGLKSGRLSLQFSPFKLSKTPGLKPEIL